MTWVKNYMKTDFSAPILLMNILKTKETDKPNDWTKVWFLHKKSHPILLEKETESR